MIVTVYDRAEAPRRPSRYVPQEGPDETCYPDEVLGPTDPPFKILAEPAFRAGFWPDCFRESTEIGPPAGRRPAGGPISVLSR